MMTTNSEKPRVKVSRKATPRYLENSALHYLSRFSTSSVNLKRVMMRKVHRSAQHHDTDPDEGQALVDDMIARFQRSGLLDDEAHATAQIGRAHV